ncbi:integrase [Streptacidiphilus sp. MAP12-16]|uniref:tyrosine-type recombinase/integrase n=1 Tax=Streptacidiphilus sp. MAP12-16 TaxID=3156300 RepID=UPI0035173F0F
MSTAVDDGAVRRNPCRIKGAAVEHAPERPVLTVEEVYRLADAIEPRFRLLVLLAVFAGLRWGELAALRRSHLDLGLARLHVRESVTVLRDYTRITGAPKSKAGVRTVHLPESVVQELRLHLRLYAQQDPDGLVFVGAKGAALARPTFSRPWRKALAKAELKNVRVHDLRHTGNTLASTTGTSLRELMARMGHSTPRAALIYQHASSDRDRVIAEALEALARAAREKGDEEDGGAAGVPVPV